MNYIKSIYNGLAAFGEGVAKAEYLIVSNSIHSCLYPIQTYRNIKDVAQAVFNGDIWSKEEYLELGLSQNEFLKVKMKTLSKVESAFNSLLKEVDWNPWMRLTFRENKPLYLSVRDLTKNEMISFFEIHREDKLETLISGNYSAFIRERQIDQGAAKTVYLGKMFLTSEKVAVLEIDIRDEKKMLECERELNILQELKNLNGIVQLKGSYTNKRKMKKIIIEEFCDAGSLKSRLGRGTRAEKVDVSLQILKIIKSIHDEGLIYGDLKPHNIFLKREPKSQKLLVRFGDFGTAHKVGSKPLGGTPYDMSPERLSWMAGLSKNDQDLDKTIQIKAEIFELGLILLEWLEADSYQEQPFPWCEKIDQLPYAHNRQDLKESFSQLKKCMNDELSKVEIRLESLEKDVEIEVYRTIIAMLNVEHPDLRPSLDEVIKVFENYVDFLAQIPTIKHVPQEIIQYMFEYLSQKDLIQVRKVCKQWSVLVSERNIELQNLFHPSQKKRKPKTDLTAILNWKPKSFDLQPQDETRFLTREFSFEWPSKQ